MKGLVRRCSFSSSTAKASSSAAAYIASSSSSSTAHHAAAAAIASAGSSTLPKARLRIQPSLGSLRHAKLSGSSPVSPRFSSTWMRSGASISSTSASSPSSSSSAASSSIPPSFRPLGSRDRDFGRSGFTSPTARSNPSPRRSSAAATSRWPTAADYRIFWEDRRSEMNRDDAEMRRVMAEATRQAGLGDAMDGMVELLDGDMADKIALDVLRMAEGSEKDARPEEGEDAELLISPFDAQGRAISTSAYVQHQLALIAHEGEARVRQHEERRRWEVERLVEEGWAVDGLEWYQVSGTATPASSNAKGKTKAKVAVPTLVIVLQKRGKSELGWHRLRKGDMIEMRPRARRHGAQEDEIIRSDSPLLEGTILNVAPTSMRVQVNVPAEQASTLAPGSRHPCLADLEANPRWLLMQGSSDILERRMEDAVKALQRSVDWEQVDRDWEARLEATLAAEALEQTEQQERLLSKVKPVLGCAISDVVLGLPADTSEAQKPPLLMRNEMVREWVEERLDGKMDSAAPGLDGQLNESQVKAIATMLGHRASLIQGPPGTGKTRTLVAAMVLLKKHLKVREPLLLTSHTNVAVDNLAVGCHEAGLKVVRAGPPEKTRESLAEVTLEGLIDRHRLKPRLDDMKLQAMRLRATLEAAIRRQKDEDKAKAAAAEDGAEVEELADGADAGKQQKTPDVMDLRKRINRLVATSWFLRQLISREILSSADVVVCTAMSAASTALQCIDFPVVFFDEGSMATEPATLIPLAKGCRQLAIIGDQRQLPPVVASTEARRGGLATSLFERLLQRGDVPTVLLDTQHRMHPELSQWPNAAFYDGLLRNDASTSSILPLQSAFSSPASEHLSFVDHSHPERRADKSLVNEGEAKLVMRMLLDLFVRNPGLKGVDVGLVTPYAAQQALLSRFLHNPDSAERRWLEEDVISRCVDVSLARSRTSELKSVEVHTVDGFEGREKAAVILSSVRSNGLQPSLSADTSGNGEGATKGSSVGFLADRRRLNVGLTRAKQRLIIAGNWDTWARASSFVDAGGAVEQLQLEPECVRRFARDLQQRGVVVRGA